MNMKVCQLGAKPSQTCSKVDFNTIKIAKNSKTQKKQPPMTPQTKSAPNIVEVDLGNGSYMRVTAGLNSPYRNNPNRLLQDFVKAGSNISIAYNQNGGYVAKDILNAGQKRKLHGTEKIELAKIIWAAIKNKDSADSLTRVASQKILNECTEVFNIGTAQAALNYYAANNNSTPIQLASL